MTTTTPPTQAPRAVDRENPWPGLAAFEEGDYDFFKGRSAEIDALMRMIFREDLTLFSSVSGLGKTSLLRAGLFPKLRAADIFPVYMRLRYDSPALNDTADSGAQSAPTLAEQCFEEFRRSADRWGYEVPVEAPSNTIWEYVRRHTERFWGPGDRLVTPLLVFDQFEELFTHGRDIAASDERVESFFHDVSQALSGSPPAWLLDLAIDKTHDQREYLYRPGVFKVLLSFREDFFAHVAGFRTLVGAIAHNHFRLGPMTFEQALAVVDGAGGHLFDDRSRGGKKAICERIVTEVAAAPTPAARTTATIDPALLSLFCRELNDKRQAKKLPLIDLDLVESAEASGIIGDFYDSCMKQVSEAARRFVEEHLVLPESRTRESFAEEAATAAHVTRADITFLIQKRILHRDEATRRGQTRLELTHDVLVGPVLRRREERERQERESRERAEEERQRQARDLAAAQERVVLLEQLNSERDRAEKEAQARRDADRQREAAEQARQKRELELELQRELDVQRERAEARTRKRNTYIGALLAALVVVTASGVQACRRDRENRRQLIATRLERAIDDSAAERPAQALARFAQVMRDDPDNIAARSLALDLLLGRVWLLPVAYVDPDVSRVTMEFNSRGNVMATAGAAETVRLWEVDTAKPIGSVVHKPGVVGVRFSRDDRWFVTIGADGTALLWDAETRTLMSKLDHPGPVTAVAFNPIAAERVDLPLLATASADGAVVLWTKHDNTVLRRVPLPHAAQVDHVEFSPDGLRLLTASAANATIWDGRAGRRLTQMVHRSTVTVAYFTPDGGTIVTGSLDGGVRLWDGSSGRQLAEGQGGGPIRGMAFDRQGKRLLTIVERRQSSTEPTAAIWNIGDPSAAATPGPRTLDKVTVIRSADPDVDGFFVNDRTVVMMTALPDTDGAAAPDNESHSGRVRLSDARSGLPLAAPLPVEATAIRVNRSGRRVMVAGRDGRIGVWTLRTPVPSLDLRGADAMLQARFSRDGKRILTASLDGTATIWDAARVGAIRTFPESGKVVSAEYSQDEKVVLTNTGSVVHVWDAESGARRPPINAEGGDFISAQLNASATAVVTASLAAPARIWDTNTGRLIREFPAAERLWYAEFSPAGDRIVTASRDGHAEVWDVKTGERIGRPLMHAGPVVDARFSRDGNRVVTASSDRTARVWAVGSNNPVADLKHLAGVTSVQFADNAQVITTSMDGTARTWTPEGAQVLVLLHDAPVDSAQVDASGRRLLTISSRAGYVRVWDLTTGQPLSRTIALPSAVWFAEFSPDGQRIVTACDDGVARVFPVLSGDASDARQWLQSLAEAVGGYAIDASGAIGETMDRGRRLETFRAEAAGLSASAESFRQRFMRWFFNNMGSL